MRVLDPVVKHVKMKLIHIRRIRPAGRVRPGHVVRMAQADTIEIEQNVLHQMWILLTTFILQVIQKILLEPFEYVELFLFRIVTHILQNFTFATNCKMRGAVELLT